MWIFPGVNNTVLQFLTANWVVYKDVIHVWDIDPIPCVNYALFSVNYLPESCQTHMIFTGRRQHFRGEIPHATTVLSTIMGSVALLDPWPACGGWEIAKAKASIFASENISKNTTLPPSPSQAQLKVKPLPTVTHYKVPCAKQLILYVSVGVKQSMKGEGVLG